MRIGEEWLSPRLLQSFERGGYEHAEAKQLPKILKDGDRLLELGGGVGFISSLASKVAKLEACTIIEANPDLISVIRETHSLNGVSANVMNAVAASRRGRIELAVSKEGNAPFYRRENFWGSSLNGSWRYQDVVNVTVIDFQDLLDEARPSVIVCDIEGGERTLFDRADLASVRHILMEVHKSEIGLRGINGIIQTLASEGLYLDPDGVSGAILLFTRS